jgi:hypothetical protein
MTRFQKPRTLCEKAGAGFSPQTMRFHKARAWCLIPLERIMF